jgi:hypothetical protein
MSRPRRAPADIAVSHPHDGRIVVRSRGLFADSSADVCRQLVGCLFAVEEVRAVEMRAADAWAQIEYTNGHVPGATIVQKIARRLSGGPGSAPAPYVNSPSDLP